MYDIAVVGGGLVGASFALATVKNNRNLRIVIIEQCKPDFSDNDAGYDSKIYAISPHNLSVLLDLGITPNQDRFGTINEMNIRGDVNSSIQFNRKDCNNQYLSKIIEYRNLHKSVIEELNKFPQVEFIFGKLSEIVDNTVVTLIGDNINIQARWLVAADGANSFVRKQFNFKVEQIPYYQSGVVANFKCEKPHLNTAHQWFLGSSILAYLPLPDNYISIVWSTDNTSELLSMSELDFSARVAQASNYTLGNLELVTKPIAFPLKLNLVDRFVNNHVILIGDAAHTIHPLAGQGVNLGFGDAWALASLMSKTNANPDLIELSRFNADRMGEVRKMQMTCHLLHRLFHNRNRVIHTIRNLGLNIFNHVEIVKKLLIKAAINY